MIAAKTYTYYQHCVVNGEALASVMGRFKSRGTPLPVQLLIATPWKPPEDDLRVSTPAPLLLVSVVTRDSVGFFSP